MRQRFFCIFGISFLILSLSCVLAFAQGTTQENVKAGEFYAKEGAQYLEQDNMEKAEFSYKLAVMFDPNNKQAKETLSKIEAAKPKVVRAPVIKEVQAEEEPEFVQTRKEAQEEAQPKKGVPKKSQAEEEGEQKLMPVGQFVKNINEKIKPWQISGEYRVSAAVQDGDFEWNKSNFDLWERNWRMLYGENKENTYDPGVFDRLRVNVDRVQDTGWGMHSNITVDPWSYVGKSKKVTVVGAWGDPVDIQLKWWSNTGKTIGESLYTRSLGDRLVLPELNVKDGKTAAFSKTSIWGDEFNIPEIEIEKTFMPLRELWVDYNQEDFKFRVFPIAYQDQAYTSDDPLELSNHHIYWEPSPWLDQWVPGINNKGASPTDFTQGRWSYDLAYYTRDGDGTRLNSLRGASVDFKPFETTEVNATIASPKSLWQGYDSFDSLPGAIRVKQGLTDYIKVGGIYTFRHGFTPKTQNDSQNHVFGADLDYEFFPEVHLKTEIATSMSKQDMTTDFETKKRGNVYQASIKKDIIRNREGGLDKGVYGGELTLTRMEDDFDPGLANYRFTRSDAFWGRHIFFDNPNPKKSVIRQEFYEGLYKPSLTYFDMLPTKIGTGIDTGRDVVRFNAEFSPTDNLEMLFDVRNVHNTNGKYIETVARNENTITITPKLTAKTILMYTDLPKTHAGVDPFLVDSATDLPYLNASMENGKDPSLGTASLGLQYDATKWLTLVGIYEYTNDREMATGSYPRGLFSEFTSTTSPYENFILRSPRLFLYDQGFFANPSYNYFNIVRLKAYLMPTDKLDIKLEYTFNDNKFAGGIDDNINHASITIDYDATKNLSVGGGYIYSRSVDLGQLAGETVSSVNDHHDFFAELRYKLRETGRLLCQYGVSTRITPDTLVSSSPYGGFQPTLDTAHIVKVLYTEKF